MSATQNRAEVRKLKFRNTLDIRITTAMTEIGYFNFGNYNNSVI